MDNHKSESKQLEKRIAKLQETIRTLKEQMVENRQTTENLLRENINGTTEANPKTYSPLKLQAFYLEDLLDRATIHLKDAQLAHWHALLAEAEFEMINSVEAFASARQAHKEAVDAKIEFRHKHGLNGSTPELARTIQQLDANIVEAKFTMSQIGSKTATLRDALESLRNEYNQEAPSLGGSPVRVKYQMG